MCSFDKGIIIGTKDFSMHIWDFTLKEPLKNIILDKIPFNVMSKDIIQIANNNKKILIVSSEGDLIEFELHPDL